MLWHTEIPSRKREAQDRGLELRAPALGEVTLCQGTRQPACARQLKRLAPSCAIAVVFGPISTRSSWLAVRRSTWSARTRSVPRRSALASSVAQAAAVELLLLDPVQTSNESRSASSSFTASTAHRHWSRRLSRAAEWWQAGAAGRLKPGRFTTRGVLTRSLTARLRGWGLWAGKPPGLPPFSGCSRPQIAESAPD